MFHRFNTISVDSYFSEKKSFYNVKFDYSIDNKMDPDSPKRLLENPAENKTTVTLSKYNNIDNQLYMRLIEDPTLLKKEILKHLLLRLFLERESNLSIKIEIIQDNKRVVLDEINSNNIPEPYSTESVYVSNLKASFKKNQNKDSFDINWVVDSNDKITLTNFKLSKESIDSNGVFLCSNNILVKEYSFPALRKNISFDGFRYITSISGAPFDKENNVNHSVDDFTFPNKKDVEKKLRDGDLFDSNKSFIFIEDIKEAINEGLSRSYSSLTKLKEDRKSEASNIAKKYGIPIEMVEKIKINLTDSKIEVTKKLFEEQAKDFANKNIEINDTYEKIISLEASNLDPFSEEYQKNFLEISDKLLRLIPQQNKDELSRYVIRRQMLADMLRILLKNEMAVQKKWQAEKENGINVKERHEALIHEMLFKRKTKGMSNDLWILNEEFVHFDGCSDLPLDKLEVDGRKFLREDTDLKKAMEESGVDIGNDLKARPDIFLFPEENKCILIELKAPEEDLIKHLDQIAGYAKLIANFSNIKMTQFYGYLIGEKINKNKLTGRYKKSISCNHWFYPNEEVKSIETDATIADLYQEVIPYSTLADRATVRNKSFAEKLGLEKVLLESEKILKDTSNNV